MLYAMCQKSKDKPTWPQLEHAIKRNFGGLETEKLNPFNEFKISLDELEKKSPAKRKDDLTDVYAEVRIEVLCTYVRICKIVYHDVKHCISVTASCQS